MVGSEAGEVLAVIGWPGNHTATRSSGS
jgi:hypothetical protein